LNNQTENPNIDAATGLDRRLHAYRPDLADAALAGKLVAAEFRTHTPWHCALPFAATLKTPGGEQGSELLSGETFMVLDVADGWAWGWSAHDHYVGYVEASALANGEGAPLPETATDPVEAAMEHLGKPYVWGGRGGAGIDCSGLVQRGYAATGVALPRDSDMQRAEAGRLLAEDATLKRGDLAFFPGHVGLMTPSSTPRDFMGKP
jgi:cell wall-associated NlpC family hydrolase